MPKGKIATSPSTEYSQEMGLVRFFIDLLENRLAGRHKERIVKRVPADECRLGVLIPWRREVDEVDPLESEEGQEGNAAVPAGEPAANSPPAEGISPIPEAPASAKREEEEVRERPQQEGKDDQDYVRRPPSSLGAEFLLGSRDGQVVIEVDTSFAVYTPHLPTFKEQTGSLGEVGEEGIPKGGMTLADVWQRRTVSVEGIRFRIPGQQNDNGAVQAELDHVIEAALSSPDAMPRFETQPKLDAENLVDEKRFNAWIEETRKKNPPHRPPLRALVEVRSFPSGDGRLRLCVYLRNDTPRGQKRSEDNNHILGDACLRVRIIEGALQHVEILPVPEDYQYDRKVWAVGHNASIEVNDDRTVLETRTLACVEQPRLTTQNDPPARFKDLDERPYEVLESIRKAMEAYADRWQDEAISTNSLELDGEFLAECRKDLDGFKAEIDRFCRGIAALRSDPRLLDAFRGMNRVMDRLARGFDRWRLFQIVFIVTQLPAIVLREGKTEGEWPEGVKRTWEDELDWADVLWFPTGGGKTEAYLGLVSCAIIYDRLRGKKFGLTAWLRFPLRMLSVQQLQRAMKMVWETEKERQIFVGAAGDGSDPVRLGYFIGASTTPNRLDARFFQRHTDSASCEHLRVVTDCPACGAEDSIQVVPDPVKSRLRHICGSCTVEIPLVVSDSEIYRYLPALIVGTVDKMATVGFQTRFGILWAGPRWKCPEHGYSFGDYCEVFECKDSKGKKGKQKTAPYDPSPTFHVQDELHLLQEELGAFAGHYETLTRYCEETAGGRPAKVIAATATIEGYEHQARHLYGVLGARRFPGRGYKRYESFYVTLESDPDTPGGYKTARFFIAFRPPAGATADVAGQVALILHEEIAKWIRNPHEGLAALPFLSSVDDLRRLIYYYSATLTYVNSLPSGTRIKDLLTRAAQEVHKGLRDLNVEYLSSRSSSGEVSEVIHRMEQPPEWEDQAYLDAVVATNMISHGVDLERINLMVMDKFPAETAEYIQASSRSGRKKVGLVAVVLPAYNLRTASIYHRFREYHQHLDRMVSPVPVNRFAKYAVQRTLPGILSGLLFGRVGPETNDLGLTKLRKALAWINADPLRAEGLLRHAYALDRGIYEGDLEEYYVKAIQERFGEILVILRGSQEDKLTDALRPKPMSSLRDVERGVPFHPKSDDHVFLYWFRKDVE
jgi:hypothetical protein